MEKRLEREHETAAGNVVMPNATFTATAWNNGAHLKSGAGYGLKISVADRDVHFSQSWKSIDLYLPAPYGLTEVNVDKPSFWNETCGELINQKIGAWLISEGKGHWARGCPPQFELIARGARAFDILPAWDSD